MSKHERPHGSELLDVGLPRFATIYADPPWPGYDRKVHGSPRFYPTLPFEEISRMPVARLATPAAHLYLWTVNQYLPQALETMARWGFAYRDIIVWGKARKDGGIDHSGVGHYFRHAAELLLFGVRGSRRTLPPARSQPTLVLARRREHSRKPDEFWNLIEKCSPGPRLELFARYPREGWHQWGNEMHEQLWTAARRSGADKPTTLVRTSRTRFVVYRHRHKGAA